MALVPFDIARIDALLAAVDAGVDITALDSALARLVPQVGRRHCDADDVLEEPFRSHPALDLHLLDASAHCIRVTDSPEQATALLIARKARDARA
ncbi:hypothetical protein Y88_0021 [Novosphingobium nitrogenifigens DSM 19370]|uniref:Uncharacterized protein n=1 Tax=Novosphingobium nitrogenifigens DSM 19370 TaxID=983920 RepID=F1Z4T9_9SPHN|nr:hypothetical protein [Novosphingobium nitrogenifigens]EGD60373.1 hypothetical protein Y88_0021 [Novosphingobium nitrogenifigens DSM 19370]